MPTYEKHMMPIPILFFLISDFPKFLNSLI